MVNDVEVSRVTPSNVPLSEGGRINCAPPVAASVPPRIVPPLRIHEPVGPVSVSVLLVLIRVPSSVSEPPTFWNVPNPAAVKVPPRYRALTLPLITPLLLQLPANCKVPPVALIVPLLLLVKVVTARPAPLVANSWPWLTRQETVRV